MWRPWSKPLELLGRFRLYFGDRTRVTAGHPAAVDAQGGWGWRNYLDAEKLFDVWAPHPASPWAPYHCVPLFAALDRIPRANLGPTPPPELDADALPAAEARARAARVTLPRHARPGAPPPPWLEAGTWTILDVPGAACVEAAVWLIAAGAQPVCTFDNWPHPHGVLRPELTIAEMLRWATTVAERRAALTPDAPPLWICDAERLGRQRGSPGQFDNRYYLDDSILPGTGLLRGAGITRVVYASLATPIVPVHDLESYFTELLAAGLRVEHADLADTALEPRAFTAPARPVPPPRSGYRRSAAGGFGTEVPEPSSGGGG